MILTSITSSVSNKVNRLPPLKRWFVIVYTGYLLLSFVQNIFKTINSPSNDELKKKLQIKHSTILISCEELLSKKEKKVNIRYNARTLTQVYLKNPTAGKYGISESLVDVENSKNSKKFQNLISIVKGIYQAYKSEYKEIKKSFNEEKMVLLDKDIKKLEERNDAQSLPIQKIAKQLRSLVLNMRAYYWLQREVNLSITKRTARFCFHWLTLNIFYVPPYLL
jgi:hypothetical protein